jgi:hypothetical protein
MTTASLILAAKRAGLAVDEKPNGQVIITGTAGTIEWYRSKGDTAKTDYHSSVYCLNGGQFDDFKTDYFPGVFCKTIKAAIRQVTVG